jgi:AraC-like DNA-binding protein
MNTLDEYNFSDIPITKCSSRYLSRKFPLHALTILSGHSRETTEDYYNDSKTIDVASHVVWQYTISGRGCIELGNGYQDLLPGSLMIVSIPGPNVYFLPEFSSHWEFVFLTMIGREAVRITQMIEQHLGNVISTEGIPQTIKLLYEILKKLFSGAIDNPFNNSSCTYQLCMKFLEEVGGIGETRRKHTFDNVKKFLRENLYRDIQVEEMAAIMNLSRSHFTRVFSREMGMSPRMYLEDLRLKTAMDILFQRGSTVKETAAQCGIYDVNYFCRLFKKRYGISPGKYRERNFAGSSPDKKQG